MSVVAIGNFDGLHVGHQTLIQTAVQLAAQYHLPAWVYTFSPHPRNAPKLMSDAQKAHYLSRMGIDRVIFQEFTPEFASQTPEAFINQVLVQRLQASHVVVGSDFAFGKKASGKVEQLNVCPHFQTHMIEPVRVMGEIASSSLVREAITLGDLDKVRVLLGRDYSLTGKVVRGAGRGRVLGFPTANLQVEQDILPPLGVYATYSEQFGFGASNMGKQPTFGIENIIQVETHFINLNQDLYGQEIEIFIQSKIRDEKKFDSVEALKEQISQDLGCLPVPITPH